MYERAEIMVPQIDGTYNVSDDSDTDSHSYLNLASSNIIVHRMRGQKQRYEINTRANTHRCLALKDDKKPNTNVKTQRQKVPDDENIDINKIVQADSPIDYRNSANTTAKQYQEKEAKRLVLEKAKRIQGQNDIKNTEVKRHMIEKAKIEALIEKHRPCTPKTPDEVSTSGTGKNAKDKGQEGTKKGKPSYKKATKDIQIKTSRKKGIEAKTAEKGRLDTLLGDPVANTTTEPTKSSRGRRNLHIRITITMPKIRVEAADLIMVKVETDNFKGLHREIEAKDLSIVSVSFKIITIKEVHHNKIVRNTVMHISPIFRETKRTLIEAEARVEDLSILEDVAVVGPTTRIMLECISISIIHMTNNQNNMVLPAVYVVDSTIPPSTAIRANMT